MPVRLSDRGIRHTPHPMEGGSGRFENQTVGGSAGYPPSSIVSGNYFYATVWLQFRVESPTDGQIFRVPRIDNEGVPGPGGGRGLWHTPPWQGGGGFRDLKSGWRGGSPWPPSPPPQYHSPVHEEERPLDLQEPGLLCQCKVVPELLPRDNERGLSIEERAARLQE